MQIIFAAEGLVLYPLAKPGFRGGTETYLERVARGLAAKGHTVHVVAPDADRCEQRGPSEFWWPTAAHPTHADVVVAVHNLGFVTPDSGYNAPILVLMTNGVDPYCGPGGTWAKDVDGFPCFSRCHVDLLTRTVPTVDPAKCFVTGLGVDLEDYPPGDGEPGDPRKVPGRVFVSNDPARGLWHALDVFDEVRKRVPHATLHVGYDFERQFALRKWDASALAQALWECKHRLETTEGVVNLGKLTREEMIREQLECQVHVWPSDPPNVGSQIHGLTQMECAAAGAALVLSDTEAFPEVFGDAATVLPLPGAYAPELERRYGADDWAEAVARLMTDADAWAEASRKARALAEQHAWEKVVSRWDEMLAELERRGKANARPVEELEAEAGVPA